MEEELEVILRAVDEASDTFESVTGAAENMGESVQGGAEQGSQGLDEMQESASTAEDPLEQISSIISGLAGAEIFNQLAEGLWDVADKAGNFEDSLMRARLEAEGAGIDVNAMTDAVSQLSSETGRAGGEIRESFIKATARGITDIGSFKSMMEGAGAQATLLGTDITTMADKMSGMAMRSSVMERTLANTGITVEELGNALGIQGATIDDVNAKWATMDTNQRAAALGMAASMNEGQTANEEYKKSWAGLQAQIDIAKGRLERLAGEVLLPVLVPALQTAGRILSWVGDVVQGVMDGPFGGLISVIGSVAAAFALAVPALIAVSAAYDFIAGSAFAAAAAELLALWPIALIAAAIAALIYVVYEVGKAFGWWTDVSSMMDAIWAGIQRVWSAFINHPDVQSFLSALTAAWNWLVPAVTGVVNAVFRFLGVSSSSNFDPVRNLIMGVSYAWQAMTFPIRLVIAVVKLFITTMVNIYNRVRVILTNIKNIFARLPGAIRGAISKLTSIITHPVQSAKSTISGIVDGIKSTISGITHVNIGSLTNKLTQPVTNAYNTIAKTVGDIISKIKSIPHNIPGIGGAFGGEDLPLGGAYGGEDLTSTQVSSIEKMEIHTTNDVNLSLDLRNVPAGIDENVLRNALVESLTDKSVLSVLVNNNDFQSLDSRAKSRILARNNRARGV